MGETTTTTITLPVRGDGTALEKKEGVGTFGLIGVNPSEGTVMYTPDPDNEENTVFWVRRATPDTTVTLMLTYAGE